MNRELTNTYIKNNFTEVMMAAIRAIRASVGDQDNDYAVQIDENGIYEVSENLFTFVGDSKLKNDCFTLRFYNVKEGEELEQIEKTVEILGNFLNSTTEVPGYTFVKDGCEYHFDDDGLFGEIASHMDSEGLEGIDDTLPNEQYIRAYLENDELFGEVLGKYGITIE